jgi:predicted ATP-grasp superfamily ATP-dependent carboligase
MYTGGLENDPAVVRQLAALRPLWGNDSSVLRRVRSPFYLDSILRPEGFACPMVRGVGATVAGRWLSKPLRGAGGTGIHFWDPAEPLQHRNYLQEYIEGISLTAIYVANGSSARLLGVTHQLVGEPWTHAAPFHYCGSIGPGRLQPKEKQELQRLGQVLASRCGLRGLFGVDGICSKGQFWPVEVNPRYSASVEVLEYATGMKALSPSPAEAEASGFVGKAILFARHSGVFPKQGPWQASLEQVDPVGTLPDFADIPDPDQTLTKGRPVLTFFARGSSALVCLAELRRIAGELDRVLFGA